MFTVSARTCCCLLTVLAASATPLVAQNNNNNVPNNTVQVPSRVRSYGRTPYPAPRYYGYGGMGYGRGGYGYGWGWGRGGATVAGSYLNGLGMAIRSQGQYNLMTSQAAVNMTEANRRAIQNQLLWTNTYFEKRRINRAARAAEHAPRLTEKQWLHISQQAAPERLESSEIDPVTGEINWPLALRAEIFADDRETLDHLFTQRAQADGAIGLQSYTQIRSAVNDAMAKLKSRIRDIDSQNYLKARTFLTSLAREADFPSS